MEQSRLFNSLVSVQPYSSLGLLWWRFRDTDFNIYHCMRKGTLLALLAINTYLS